MQAFKTIQPANFVYNETLQKYVVTILADAIGFDGTQFYSVHKVVRKESSTDPWRNVIFQYEINSSGDLLLYFDEQFTGRVALITDRETTNALSLGGINNGDADN